MSRRRGLSGARAGRRGFPAPAYCRGLGLAWLWSGQGLGVVVVGQGQGGWVVVRVSASCSFRRHNSSKMFQLVFQCVRVSVCSVRL